MKCCPCTDKLIQDGGSYPETDLPEAITQAPIIQAVNANGMSMAQLVMLPVCFACRAKMLNMVSKSGLVTG